ncbi:hypothetical protein V6N13_040324 [Hibiscus sabdariffa]
MCDRTDCFFFHFFVSDNSFGSRWCESRSRLHLGRSLVRLEGPSLGHRQPCRLRCQVSVWCFVSDNWYSDGGSSVSVFFVETDGFFDWSSAGVLDGNRDDGLFVWSFVDEREGSSDDGSNVRGIVIGFCSLKVLFWEVLWTGLGFGDFQEMLLDSFGIQIGVLLIGQILVGWWLVNMDDVSSGWLWFDGKPRSCSGFVLLDLGKQGWFAKRSMVVFCPLGDCKVVGLRSQNYQRDIGIRIGGSQVVGWSELCVSERGWLWWWRWCASQAAGVGFWWRYRRKEAQISSLKGLNGGYGGFQGGQRRSQSGGGKSPGKEKASLVLAACRGWKGHARGGPRAKVWGPQGRYHPGLLCRGGHSLGCARRQDDSGKVKRCVSGFHWIRGIRCAFVSICWVKRCISEFQLLKGIRYVVSICWVAEGPFDWFFSGVVEGNRVDGLIVLIGEIAVEWWMANRDDGSFGWRSLDSISGAVLLILGRQRWLTERGVGIYYPLEGCMVVGGSLECPQRKSELRIGGSLVKEWESGWDTGGRKLRFSVLRVLNGGYGGLHGGQRHGGLLALRFAEGDIPLGVRDDRFGRRSALAKWHARKVFVFSDTGLERGVLGSQFSELEQCVLKIDDSGRVKRCVFGPHLAVLKRAQFGIEVCFHSNFVGWLESVVSSMADEVAKLMSNLNFSEEEMIEMEPMEEI